MKKRQKRHLIASIVEFIKLQLAGNILFWGTLGGTFVLKELMHWSELAALATAALVAHVFFFLADKNWVFDEKNKRRKTSTEITRFVIFMGMNYCINIALTQLWWVLFGVSVYVAQFLNSIFFTFWTYAGLKLWVFHPDHTRHPALTYHSPRKAYRGKPSTK